MNPLDRIRQVAQQQPTATAIVDRTGRLTYAQLIEAVEERAVTFRAFFDLGGRVVAVEKELVASCVIDWLAAWSADGAFVAIDPSLPTARRDHYRRVAAVVSDAVGVRAHHGDRSVPASTRYIFYSSGSTGQPKAVLMPFDGIATVIDAQIAMFAIDKTSRVLGLLSPGFDASMSDVFTALFAGASLSLFPRALESVATLYEVMTRFEITHVDLPPSLLDRIDPDRLPQTLQTIVVGGESCSHRAVTRFASRRLVNCYGPTEATICTSMSLLRSPEDVNNIGRPMTGVTYRIESGELWVSGAGIALGYLDGDDSRFVRHDGKRWFRTGDRVERIEGSYRFLGRVDRQFKLRGKLVAPEEVEAQIEAFCDARSRVEPIGGQLVAWVEISDDESAPLEQHLRSHLPEWMVPRVVTVSKLPRGATGKIDRSRLDTAALDSASTESIFCSSFSDALGFPISVDDDFFTAGGDSLLAFDAAATSLVPFAPRMLTRHRTARALAAAVRDRGTISIDAIHRHLDSLPVAANRERPEHVEQIFVTGATGFLGQFVVDALLRRGFSVTCLVRANDDAHAQSRIGRRDITAVCGDLDRPRLGLSQSRFDQIARSTDTIVHLAADVNLSKPYRADTVSRQLDHLFSLHDAGLEKKFVFASTLSVFVGTDHDGDPSESNRELDRATVAYGGYAADKILAELVVRRRSTDPTIVRLGLLTGDRTHGRFPVRDSLPALIRSIAEFGVAPRSERLAFDLTPVDFAADAFAALVSSSGTFHVANRTPATLTDLVDAIDRVTPVAVCDGETFVERLMASRGRDRALSMMAMCRFLAPQTFDLLRSGDLFLATDRLLSSHSTDELLQRYGVTRTDRNEQLLDRYVQFALR